jgi:hypothetical protein
MILATTSAPTAHWYELLYSPPFWAPRWELHRPLTQSWHSTLFDGAYTRVLLIFNTTTSSASAPQIMHRWSSRGGLLRRGLHSRGLEKIMPECHLQHRFSELPEQPTTRKRSSPMGKPRRAKYLTVRNARATQQKVRSRVAAHWNLQVTGDNHALNFASSLVNLRNPSVTVMAFDRVILQVPVSTVNLNCL